MIFDTLNIAKELALKQDPEEKILQEIQSLLTESETKDSVLLKRLNESPENHEKPLLLKDKLSINKVYSEETIKQICIKYRLRFLDSKHFKAEYPYEALHQIKEFEQTHQVKIQHFKIIAPYDMFQLTDVNEDPLLFAQLSDNNFYLLHKWGHDLKWHRGILNFPLQSIYTFFLSTILIAAIVALSFPFDWLNVSRDSEYMFRFWLTTHFTIAFFFFFIFLGSMSNASFSDSAWNSKYYNQ